MSPQTRVVAYTGFEEETLAATARELGAAALIRKSLPIDELADQPSSILGLPAGDAPHALPPRRRMEVVPASSTERGEKGDNEDQAGSRRAPGRASASCSTRRPSGWRPSPSAATSYAPTQALADLMILRAGRLGRRRLWPADLSGQGDLLDAALS